jgi:hypothetical protein
VAFEKSHFESDLKKSNRRLFRQIPSHAKAADKIGKVLSLGHSSCVWVPHYLKAGWYEAAARGTVKPHKDAAITQQGALGAFKSEVTTGVNHV